MSLVANGKHANCLKHGKTRLTVTRLVLVQREFFGQIIEQSRANPKQFLINFYTPLRIAPDR